MAKASWLWLWPSLALAGAQQVVQAPEPACSRFRDAFARENVTINFTQHVTAGTNVTLDQSTEELRSCNTPGYIAPVDLCRVAMYVSTTERSGITLEAWLPTNWTGRFLATGNGGLNGCIKYTDIVYGVESGFATVGANNGHNGTSGKAFYHNSDVVTDFAWRSLYTETVVGKDIVRSFYGQELTNSYYLGCSTGGRQGFKMAQDYPDFFDGIIAGAPALAFNNLSSWSGSFYPILTSNTSATYIEPAKWALIHQDILNQCDHLDGVEDGILEDASRCYYNPLTLQCNSTTTNTSTCLTAPQVTAVNAIFSDFYGENGSLTYPRMQPGSEIIAANLYYNAQPFPYTSDWFRYAIYNDPTWDPLALSAKDSAYAANLNPANIETWNGDLSKFKAAGGKLIHWHGQMDAIITSSNSNRYYTHVATTMSQASSELDQFYRFFRISGAGHCQGGDGAWNIGQGSGMSASPSGNVLQKIMDWVEKGDEAAPEYLTGVKFVNGLKDNGVEIERKHCKYPLRNRCVDPSRYKEASAWRCIA